MSSRANCGRVSGLPRAQRASIVTVSPSTYPTSRKPSRKASKTVLPESGNPGWRNPMMRSCRICCPSVAVERQCTHEPCNERPAPHASPLAVQALHRATNERHELLPLRSFDHFISKDSDGVGYFQTKGPRRLRIDDKPEQCRLLERQVLRL